MSIASPAPGEKNPYVHGLRGLLAVGVLVFHVANSGLPTFRGFVADGAHQALLSLAHCVELFFGISGIVMVRAFSRADDPLAFLEERICRIFPLLWITVFAILALSQLSPTHQIHVDSLTLLGNLLALPNLVPMTLIHPAAWSLSYEFAFYWLFVLFGLLRPHVGSRAAALTFGLLLLTLAALHVRATPFLLGTVIALRSGIRPTGRGFGSMRWPGFCLLVALLAWHEGYRTLGLASTLPELTWARVLHSPIATLCFLLASVAAFLGLAGVVEGAGRLSRLLTTSIAQWLGTISFSLYMWQTITGALIKQAMRAAHAAEFLGVWSQVCFLLLSLAVTLALAHGSQVYIEGHVSRRVRRSLRTLRTAVPGHATAP